MFKTIILPFGSFIFVSLLLIIYLFKMKETKVGNKLYALLLIILLIALGTEIISVFTIYNHDKYPIINEIICRLHTFSIITWIVLMGLYLISFANGYNINDFKSFIVNDLKVKYMSVIYGILVLIFFFLKFDYVVLKDTAYLSGIALYYGYFIGLIVLCYAIYLIIKKHKNINIKKLPLAILVIETCITLPLSLVILDIYILTSSLAFKVYILYFMTENQDLYAIKKLKETNESIETSNKAKTEFLSNVTNEFRLPIKSIIGISETLVNKNELDIEEDKKSIKHIFSYSNNLIEIINNVLDLSRIETNSEVVIEEEYKLKDIIHELKSIVDSRINDNVTFDLIYDESIPSIYKGDKNKIYKILLNCLSNSVKYTEVGKISLNIEYIEETLKFKISDTGTGIKENDYNKLFEKFSRLEDAIKNEVEGLGLGLVITRKLVDIMNGTITFDSIYGAGTNFYIELKQKVIDKTPIGKIMETKIEETEIKYLDCSNLNVLLVDDNKLNLKVAEKLLKPYKFNVSTVLSGKECIYKIKEGNKYDIIFLDHMMPEMDGIEVLHILKKLSKNFDIPPIVALTANAVTGMREMYLNEGFDEYVSKPINISELNKVINKFFRRDNNE